MTYFVSYDISDAKRLQKVAKIIENYGWRIQYSFFQCEVEHEVINELTKKLLNVIDKETDSLIIIPLCKSCSKPIFTLGNGSVYVEETFQIL